MKNYALSIREHTLPGHSPIALGFFIVFERYSNSLSLRKILVMQMILVHKNNSVHVCLNAIGYCSVDIDHFASIMQMYFSIPDGFIYT